jgi:TonB family protein
MSGLKVFLSRMNGWALSLLLHGGVAAIAGLSVFTVHLSGGSGRSAGGAGGTGMTTESFAATLRSSDEALVSGTMLPDVPQYSHLTSEKTPTDPAVEDVPPPSIPFDVFAVGSSETPVAHESDPNSDPHFGPPGSLEGRTTRLPATAGDGRPEGPAGSGGQGGSGGGNDSGDGSGDGGGTGDGKVTGVYTPAPAYPSEARRRNIEGSVLVELAIAADGSCAVKQIVQSSGFPAFDTAVEKTVRVWKYLPAAEDGRPTNTTRRMRFTFRLGQ